MWTDGGWKRAILAMLAVGAVGVASGAAAQTTPAPLTLETARAMSGEALATRSLDQLIQGAWFSPTETGLPGFRRLIGYRLMTAPRLVRPRLCLMQVVRFEYQPTAAAQAQIQAAGEKGAFIDAPSEATRLRLTDLYMIGPPGAADCRPSQTETPFTAPSDHVADLAVQRLEAFLAAPAGWPVDCLNANHDCPLSIVSLAGLRSVSGGGDDPLVLRGEGAGRTGWKLTMAPGRDAVSMSSGPIPPS